MNYAHLAPLANLIGLAGGQMSSFDSTSTKKASEADTPADFKPNATSKSFGERNNPQSLYDKSNEKPSRSATDVYSNHGRSNMHSRGPSEVPLVPVEEEEPNREETVIDVAAVTHNGVGRDKHVNIIGELEDLLGPFEQQKVIVNNQLVRNKTYILKSPRSDKVMPSPEKAEMQQDI